MTDSGRHFHPIIEAIRAKRKELEISQQELADAVGVPRQTIDALENGDTNCSFLVLDDICVALDLRIHVKEHIRPTLDDLVKERQEEFRRESMR